MLTVIHVGLALLIYLVFVLVALEVFEKIKRLLGNKEDKVVIK